VLYNFLSNAVKFTPEGGRVTIRLRPEDAGHFRIEVEDNGAGIPAEDIGRLFVEFQQLDGGFAKKHGGTGLGLALTRGIVEAQGGRVGVRSAPGEGSLFFAIFPKVPPPFPAEKPSGRTHAGVVRKLSLGRDSATILVVEDKRADRSVMLQALLEAGYAVEVAATGTEALDFCRERRFDAITKPINTRTLPAVLAGHTRPESNET